MRAQHRAAFCLVGIMLTASACGGGESSTGSGTSEGGLEKTELTVGVLPLADYAAVYWAQDQGMFADAGLDVTLQPISGGPVGIQSAVTGEVDCSFANGIATTVAQSNGVPVDMVALSSALGDESNVIMVRQDSPIQDLADLDGKTIAVNTTNSIGDVTFNALAAEEGGDIQAQFVEVPFGEMIAGVEGGSIDAAHFPEPFRSAAVAAGLRQVVDLTSGPNADLAAGAFVCGSQFVQDNPNTTAAFAEAIYAAGADITANEADFRTWLPSIAQVSPDVAQNLKLPSYFSAPDPDALQRLIDLLTDQGLLDGSLTPEESLYQP